MRHGTFHGRLFGVLLGGALGLLLATSSSAQTTYTLGFDGPDLVEGAANTAVARDYVATVTQTGGGLGAQGWSISMAADGAAISGITTNGTMAAPVASGGLQNGGFEKTELTTLAKAGSECEGKNGAVSAIVLSFTQPITLDPAVVSTLAVATLQLPIPAAGESSATLRFVDGCQGAGQPVTNNMTQDGKTVVPVKGQKAITTAVTTSCVGTTLNLGFTAAAVKSDTTAGDPLGALLGTEGAGGTIDVEVGGPTALGDAFAGIASALDPVGAQGWSIAVAASGDGTLTAATTAGTTAAPAPGGLQSGGFEKTELVDPAKEPTGGPLKGTGPQGPGAVSAIVLSFTQPITLPAVGAESVLKLTVEGALGDAAVLSFKDGLQGAGQPVSNVVTVAGATKSACNTKKANVTLSFIEPQGPPNKTFKRGNANNDGKVDIADPIWIINQLFRSGPVSPCDEALDSNDDDMIDATDAVYLIAYLFQAGAPPVEPFTECGLDGDDELGCAEDQGSCQSSSGL